MNVLYINAPMPPEAIEAERVLRADLAVRTGQKLSAEVPEVRFAQQSGMGYLQFNVMRHRDLLQAGRST